MMKDPVIKIKDLILRELKLTDYENYLEYVMDDKIKRQFLFNYDKDSCFKRLEEIVLSYENENKPFIWAIALKENDELVGIISVDKISFRNKFFSLAYGIREKHRGNGYAYQASLGLINYMFNNYDMHRLEIACNTDNIASQKTIEKLGAKFEGIARESKYYDGGFKDRRIYSILKNEWDEFNNGI